MKDRLLLFKSKWQVPFLLGSAFLPACLLLGAYAAPDMPWHTCLIALVYLACSYACLFLPGKFRIPASILSIAAILFTGFRLLMRFKSPAMVFPPLLYVWLLLETLPVYGKDAREELPPHVFVLGAVMHLAGQAVLFIARVNSNPMFLTVQPGLSGAFVCFFLLTLLNFNRINMLYSVSMGKAVPRHIFRFNRALTIILAAVTLFIGCMPAVVRFIKGIWNAVTGLIVRFIAWIHSLFPAEETIMASETAERGDPLVPYAENNPGLFAKILEIFLYVIMAAFVAFVIWLAVRYTKRIIKWIWKRFQEYVASISTGDYVDEISDTREDGVKRRVFGGIHRRKDPLKGISERKLAPAARIRFYYLRLLVRHKDWKLSHTARENLPEPAAVIYERARYSVQEITEADARSFLELTGERK